MASIVEIIVRTIDESTGDNSGIIGSFTEMQSVIMLGREALEAVGKVYDGTVGKAITYADSVRQLSLVTGMSTESSSRFLDVAGKLGVEMGTLQTALRFMAKNGVEPSLEGVAKLSDEYNALSDPIQKDQFLIENFGRSGLNMAFMMSQGSEALRTMNAQVNEGLVLTQQQTDAAHENAVATKELKESWEAFTIQIGNSAIPTITNLINQQLDLAEATKLAKEHGDTNLETIHLNQAGYMQQAEAIREARSATNDYADAAERAASRNEHLASTTPAVIQSASAFTANYQDRISLLGSLQTSETSYEDKAKKLTDERMDLERRKALVIKYGWDQERDTVDGLNKKIADNSAASDANATQHELDSHRIILSYLEQQLAAGGLTATEVGFLIQKGKEWGIYSDKVVGDMMAAEAEAKRYTDVLNSIPGHISTVLDLYSVFGDNARIAGSGSKRASGGYAGGMTRVGEYGPEMVDLPQGSYVHTAGDTAAASKGATTVNFNVNFSGVVTDPQMTARQLKPAMLYVLREAGLKVAGA